jgi:hypothetical protein
MYTGNTVAMVVGIVLLSLLPTAIFLGLLLGFVRRQRRLLAEGEPAEALVLAQRPRSVRLNGSPLVELSLEVRRSGHAPYQAKASTFVPPHASWLYRVGAALAVRIDPRDPRRVAVADAAAQQLEADPEHRLRRLDSLRAKGLISDAEYDERRAAIVAQL